MMRLLTRFSSMNIGRKLTLSIIVFVIVPILTINTIYYKGLETFAHENILQSEQQRLHFAAGSVDKLVEQMISVTNIVCFDKQLSIKLMKKKHGIRLPYSDLTQVYNILLNAQKALFDYNSYINLYDAYGECISLLSSANEFTTDMTVQLDTLRAAINAGGRFVWFAPHTLVNQATRTNYEYLSIGRLVDGTSVGANNACVLLLFIDAAQLAGKLLDSYTLSDEREDLFIVDGEGRIILHRDKALLGTFMAADRFAQIAEGKLPYLLSHEGKRELMINYQKIQHTGWWLVKLTDYSAQLSALATIRYDSIVFTLIVLLFFILITSLICRSTMGPLKRLQKQIANVRQGDFKTTASYAGKNEIAQLGQNFNQMIHYIDDLIERMRLEQKSKEQLRLELMQAQINPHFIFNTLNTIKWMAVIHNDQDIASLVQEFGRIIGMSLKDLNKLIPLKSELANLNSYMNIQRMRFNYPLALEIRCAEEDMHWIVPRLVLQPIVENAVVHGFDASYERELHILVRVTRQGKDLQLLIWDDGIGIEAAKLQAITEDLREHRHKNRFNRIGLQNVHKRVQMLFGEQYGITVQSETGAGTEVELRLPQTEGNGREDEND